MTTVSVVVCTLGEEWLSGALRSLEGQTFSPDEVVVVYKAPRSKVEEQLDGSRLNLKLVEQREGYVTGALNLGRMSVQSDVTLFLDDDARAPPVWVERYVKMFAEDPDTACFSSRDILTGPDGVTRKPADAGASVALYRRFVRPWLHPPLPLLRKYSSGVYVSKRFRVTSGPLVPWKQCPSLPYRGANMAVATDPLKRAVFPERPGLRRGLGWEQYLGLQLVIAGHTLRYTPDNPVTHLVRPSLSRSVPKREEEAERQIMEEMLRELVARGKSSWKQKPPTQEARVGSALILPSDHSPGVQQSALV